MADAIKYGSTSKGEELIELGRHLVMDTWRLRWAHMIFTTEARAEFYESLAIYIRRKVRLTEALRYIWEIETKDGTIRANSAMGIFLPVVLYRMQELGDQWHLAFEDWIPSVEALLLSASPQAGLTPAALLSLADIARRQAKWKGKIRKALAQPLLVGVFIIALFYAAAIIIFPKMMQLVPNLHLTGSAAAFKATSDFLVDWGYLVLPSLAVLPNLLSYMAPRWTGTSRMWVEKTPGFSFYRQWTGASFLMALAALVRANLTIPQALRRLASSSTPYMRERIEAIIKFDDKPLGYAMDESGFEWPDDKTIRQVKIHMSGHNPSEGLQSLANEWLDRLSARMDTVAEWVSTGGNIAVGLFIVWLSFAMNNIINAATAAAKLRGHM